MTPCGPQTTGVRCEAVTSGEANPVSGGSQSGRLKPPRSTTYVTVTAAGGRPSKIDGNYLGTCVTAGLSQTTVQCVTRAHVTCLPVMALTSPQQSVAAYDAKCATVMRH